MSDLKIERESGVNSVNGKQVRVTPQQLAVGHTGHVRSQVTQRDSANADTTSVSM